MYHTEYLSSLSIDIFSHLNSFCIFSPISFWCLSIPSWVRVATCHVNAQQRFHNTATLPVGIVYTSKKILSLLVITAQKISCSDCYLWCAFLIPIHCSGISGIRRYAVVCRRFHYVSFSKHNLICFFLYVWPRIWQCSTLCWSNEPTSPCDSDEPAVLLTYDHRFSSLHQFLYHLQILQAMLSYFIPVHLQRHWRSMGWGQIPVCLNWKQPQQEDETSFMSYILWSIG